MNYISRKIGLCICAVQLIASAVFFVALWLMNLLPAKYVTIIGLVLLLFFVCVVSTQLLSKKKGIAGKVISILKCGREGADTYACADHQNGSFKNTSDPFG